MFKSKEHIVNGHAYDDMWEAALGVGSDKNAQPGFFGRRY